MNDNTIAFKPIGYVRRESGTTDRTKLRNEECTLHIHDEYTEALEGIEDFSHLHVIWYFDRNADEPVELKIHPQRRTDLHLVGLFATRSPVRPNLIALTLVKVIERTGNIVRVTGLDALDGTPILDIKPFTGYNRDLSPSYPAWLHQLRREATPPLRPPAGDGGSLYRKPSD